jgi:hypothetical protein
VSEEEIAARDCMKLCEEKMSKVIDTGGIIRDTCAHDDHVAERFDELDDVCHSHIGALQNRLRLLHSFTNLWVNTARIPKPGDSALTQSGNREIDLRVLFFKKFDVAVVGVQCSALRPLLKELWKVREVWARFKAPASIVKDAFVARCHCLMRESMLL